MAGDHLVDPVRGHGPTVVHLAVGSHACVGKFLKHSALFELVRDRDLEECMPYSADGERLIDVMRWHIVRADGQRQGLWMRAAALLSADALVIAGTTVLASAVSKAAWWSLATTALPLAATMISIFEAISVIGGVRNWGQIYLQNTIRRLLYCTHFPRRLSI
jgi:hypothetical protein